MKTSNLTTEKAHKNLTNTNNLTVATEEKLAKSMSFGDSDNDVVL